MLQYPVEMSKMFGFLGCLSTSLSGFLLLQFAGRNGMLSATRPEEVGYQWISKFSEHQTQKIITLNMVDSKEKSHRVCQKLLSGGF